MRLTRSQSLRTRGSGVISSCLGEHLPPVAVTHRIRRRLIDIAGVEHLEISLSFVCPNAHQRAWCLSRWPCRDSIPCYLDAARLTGPIRVGAEAEAD